MLNINKKVSFVGLFLLLATFYFGCDKMSISEPNVQTKVLLTNSEMKFAKNHVNNLPETIVNQKWITREVGGVVSNSNESVGLNAIYFSPYSLPQDTLITFVYNPSGAVAELEPHGIQFQNTVKLQLSYKNFDLGAAAEDDLRIWYYNEDTGMWKLIGGTVDKGNKVVVANIKHFSRYAVGDLP